MFRAGGRTAKRPSACLICGVIVAGVYFLKTRGRLESAGRYGAIRDPHGL